MMPVRGIFFGGPVDGLEMSMPFPPPNRYKVSLPPAMEDRIQSIISGSVSDPSPLKRRAEYVLQVFSREAALYASIDLVGAEDDS